MFFQQLRTFVISAKFENFSRAADTLHLTQSAVTHQIKLLEEHFGLKLYHRHRRGIRLTDEGRKLLEHAREILAGVRDMEELARSLQGRDNVSLSIAAHRGMVRYRLPDVIKAFRTRYIGANITIFTRVVDDDIIGLVMSGEADFGIVTSWNTFRQIHFHEFVSYDMMLCVGDQYRAEHPRIHWDRLSLEEIAAVPLVLYEKVNPIRRGIDRVFEEHHLTPRVIIEIGGPDILLEYARIGLGVSIISALPLHHRKIEGVKVIPVTHYFGRLGYGVIYRQDKYFSPALVDFLSILDPQLVVDGRLPR
ncbi:MAG: LysR family transcriptional regulator [Acidobacteria bacterium]|nr:LysR family transcriptional regulator [Acidobacteriota bacterium]